MTTENLTSITLLLQGWGATRAALAPGQAKTTITWRRAAAGANAFYFAKQGKTTVLLVLPPMAPLQGTRLKIDSLVNIHLCCFVYFCFEYFPKASTIGFDPT